MRTVYACTFDVVPEAGEPAAACFERLTAVAAAAFEAEAAREWRAPARPAFDGRDAAALPGHSLRSSRERAGDCELAEAVWTRPGPGGDGIVWTTALTLARDAGALQASVIVGVASAEAALKPLAFDVRRPGIVDELVAAAACYVGRDALNAEPLALAAPEARRKVADVLLDPERALPVFVMTPGPEAGRPAADPGTVQAALLGFADVWVLRDRAATYELTDRLGRELSCFNGACRLYWPGLRPSDSPRKHPIYFADSLRLHQENGRPIERHLFRLLSGVAGFRMAQAGVVAAAQAAVRRQAQQRVRDDLFAKAAHRGELAEVERALEAAWDEIAALKRAGEEARRQVDELTVQAEELAAELEDKSAALAAAWRAAPAAPAAPPPPPAPPAGMTCVADAVARAEAEFAGRLVFLPTARASAADSPYQHPDKVYELFAVLGELVGRWQVDGRLGVAWKKALLERGIDFRDNISPTSRGKYGDEYTFTYGGRQVLFANHVTLGVHQPDRCLSVHWHRDDDRRVIAVGWCGRHLTNTLS